MGNVQNDKFVEVFAGSLIDVEIVKSLLDDSMIQSYIKDEYLGNIVPFQASPGGVGAVKLLVPESSSEKAQSIVNDYIKNINTKD